MDKRIEELVERGVRILETHNVEPGESRHADYWKTHRTYLVEQIYALFDEEGIRKALLKKAVDLIKAWHNGEAEMKLGHEQAEKMWQIYYEQSPEMKEIRQALKEGK